MKLFLDSANLDDIRTGLQTGVISGITTNPSLIVKENPEGGYYFHLKQIASILSPRASLESIPLSAALTEIDPATMIEQAAILRGHTAYQKLAIKVPVNWDNLPVITALRLRGFAVNATCVFDAGQALVAANSGARYISFFYGRMIDSYSDKNKERASKNIEAARNLLDRGGYKNCEIIAGSVRDPDAIGRVMMAGAHIATVGLKALRDLVSNEAADKSAAGFTADFNAWRASRESTGTSVEVEPQVEAAPQ